MRFPRLILTLIALLAVSAAMAACGGGDGVLSDEEYFKRMDEIDKELDAQFDAVCEAEDISAKQCATDFSTAASNGEDLFKNVSPPDDVKDEHDELVAAMGEFGANIESAGADFQDDDPADALFDSGAVDDTRLQAAFCAIQDLADAKNIEADVGCDRGEEQPDPATLEPVETSEVHIQDFVFDPPHIQVAVGDTITFRQGTDEEPHTATADDASFDTGTLTAEGEKVLLSINEPGAYPYFCEIHPEMLGLVTVVE